MMREFLRLESSAGIVLVIAAIVALVLDNSPWAHVYQQVIHYPVGFDVAFLHLRKALFLWINEGLMAVFFLLVGLEIKREMRMGELNTWGKRYLPALAAVGGMLIPALFFVVINWQHPSHLRGWAIPTATDIAFSLGILALLGSRVPSSLKVFLTALAIFDDLGGILIIAFFYTRSIGWAMLGGAALCVVLLVLMNRMGVSKVRWYACVGLLLWFFVLKSGVHATLSGVVLAFAIPIKDRQNPSHSPLKTLEHRLHPWVAFLILPIFALANAGVSFAGMHLSQWLSPLTLGVALGLFVGKQLGVASSCALGMRLGWVRMPRHASWRGLYGVGVLSGVGFTMSLFIGGLAFGQLSDAAMAAVRLGVLSGSLLSGVLGYALLLTLPKRAVMH